VQVQKGNIFGGIGVDLYKTNRPAYGVNGTYGAYIYNAELQRIIKAGSNEHINGGRPLFIYCALQDQHAPQQVTSEFQSLFNSSYTSEYAIYNGMGSAADSVFGNATRALRENGMWENTLIVMSSDNGGPAGVDGGDANNWPLRGGKKTEFEGGVRINAFLSGGFIPPALRGQRRDGYLHVCDWYATLLPLAGADGADDHPGVPPIDGLDMWGYITGKLKDSPRTEMMLSNEFKRGTLFSAALIVGDYKLILGTQLYGFWQGPVFPNATVSQVCAYELASQRGHEGPPFALVSLRVCH
jgi:arylsulfatase B